MTTLNERLTLRLGYVIDQHIAPIFKPGTKFTVIARTPGNNEADVMVTSDELPEIAALIERSAAREALTP